MDKVYVLESQASKRQVGSSFTAVCLVSGFNTDDTTNVRPNKSNKDRYKTARERFSTYSSKICHGKKCGTYMKWPCQVNTIFAAIFEMDCYRLQIGLDIAYLFKP